MKVEMTKAGFVDGDVEETGLDSLVSCENFGDSLLLSLHTFFWNQKQKERKEKGN